MLNNGQPQSDLGTGAPLDIRVIETSSIAQTLKDDARYVALSHCWGSPDVAARVMQTTRETMGAFTQSIPWRGLTKTFQDAILVTKHIGIRYIWIDSLCIVQDDVQDWAREASRMATVYANANLTIAATGATDGHQGLFINRGNEPVLRPGVHEIKLPVLKDPIYVRRYLGDVKFRRRRDDPLEGLTETPLLRRCWAFQEGILSPSTLHFTKNELMFEDDKGLISCECGTEHHGISVSDFTRDLFITKGKSYSKLDHWYRIVERYASRLLTFESDRLPALSGVATSFQQQYPTVGSYLAGLWEADILLGLHWKTARTVQPRQQPTLGRKTLLSAPPTWSWVSVGGNYVWWPSVYCEKYLVESISATCFPLTSDDKGMVAGGRITLRGRLCLAALDLNPHSSTTDAGRLSISLIDDSMIDDSMASYAPPLFFPDVELCSAGGVLPAVYFLPLSIHKEEYILEAYSLEGLVLCRETKEISTTNQVEHSMKETATFSRVGCAVIETKPKEELWFIRGIMSGKPEPCSFHQNHEDMKAWFTKWRDTVFNKFGQEQVLTIV